MSAELDLQGFGRLTLFKPPPFRILYVEDDPTNASAVVENLQERGLTNVDIVTNAAEATEKILQTAYDVVMADVVLDNAPQVKGPDKQGDEWLLESLSILRGAKCAVITGRRKRIVDPERLKSAGVRVIEKGTSTLEFFTEIEGYARLKTDVIHDEIATAVQSILTGKPILDKGRDRTAGGALADAAAAALTQWIRSLADGDKQHLWVAGRAMSPREVMNEVAVRSDVGNRIIAMCIREMTDALGITDAAL